MCKPCYKITHGSIGEALCCYTDGVYKDADVALTEYEEKIRADGRQKFAEMLSKVNWDVIKDNVDIPQFILNLSNEIK